MDTETLRIGIAGIGTVGAGVVQLLRENADDIAARCGRQIVVSAVSARDRNKNRGLDLSSTAWENDPVALAARADVDVVVELIGGAEGSARALVEAALAANKPVVTANKALIAQHGLQIVRLAELNNSSIRFEAAVAGGIPILKALREGLPANRFTRIAGILNGTCNYILTEMQKSGRDFSDVLGEAQAKGYAEADPSFDIDGVDTAHKLAILAAIAFNTAPNLPAVHIEGIRTITAEDINFAAELGYVVKLLGIASMTPQGILQRVHPCLVPKDAPIATVDGVYNAVAVEGNAVGQMMFEGRGAGAGPTASAVVADIMDIALRSDCPPFGVKMGALKNLPSASMDSLSASYYIRLVVIDQPGVLAEVTSIFASEGLSMRSFLQRSRMPDAPVQLVITTHETNESALQRAIAKNDGAEAHGSSADDDKDRKFMNATSKNQAAMSQDNFPANFTIDRNFAMEAVRVTEAAALSASHWMGRGCEKDADRAAVNAMREALNGLSIDGTVVIGEGERDKAPMLYIGEKVGTRQGPKVDIALDPLEGTTLCATGGPNALAVIAIADKGGFLHAPDVYMDKIAVGGGLPEGVIDLDNAPDVNVKNLARAKKCDISDLVVCILDRPRHEELIAKTRETGARIQLITDGDVTGVIATARSSTGVDLYMGQGGAPEGVLACAALRSIGGQFQGRLIFREEEERERARRIGITDLSRKYMLEELASGDDIMFAATGVTNGTMLRGVRRFKGGAKTHSIIMRSKTGTVRMISAEHNFDRKTWVDSKKD